MRGSKLDLKDIRGRMMTVRLQALKDIRSEIEDYLTQEPQMNSLTFVKNNLFSREIQSNNLVEGYGDTIPTIENLIAKTATIDDPKIRHRILNLYEAYKYILDHRGPIDKDGLRKLYSITSDDLLDLKLLLKMGPYYRKAPVWIYRNGKQPDEGMPFDRLDEFMDAYFKFLNDFDMLTIDRDSEEFVGTREFIKSQIAHYYFVYIHPFFDVNGRTSRTMAMWYLLNKKAYAYIIFNRGISFSKGVYYSKIVDTTKTKDLTYFVRYMLETVQKEFEKEYLIARVAEETAGGLTNEEAETLLFYLSLNEKEKTTIDIAKLLNRYNNKFEVRKTYDERIVPLLDKGIFDVARETKKKMSSDLSFTNKVITLRPIDMDPEKVKHLNL